MPNFLNPINPKTVRDPYATVARCYGACLDPVIIRWKKKALKLHPPRKGAAVLDAGCGTGAQLDLYRSHGCHVFGLDMSAGMIAAARNRFQGALNLCRATAAGMPFRDQTFELVLLSMMLHEITPDIRTTVLAEAGRVLTDSGRIIIIDYCAGRMVRPIGRLIRCGIRLIEMAAGRPHFDNFRNFMKTGGLPLLLKKQRLLVERHDKAAGGNIGLYSVRKDLSKDPNPDMAVTGTP